LIPVGREPVREEVRRRYAAVALSALAEGAVRVLLDDARGPLSA
jgi:hypothetical protein